MAIQNALKKTYGYVSLMHQETIAQRNALPNAVVEPLANMYRTPAGTRSRVTGMGDTPSPMESGYVWPDAICVGEILEWICAADS